jgi:tol-pal system protein YbgF
MLRLCLVVFALLVSLPASAQTQVEGQLRLQIQQLEAQLRQLIGENERLRHEVQQLRAAAGLPPEQAAAPVDTGAIIAQPLPGQPADTAALPPGAPPGSIAADDPLIAPDGVEAEAPIDLSVLAAGSQPGDPSGGLNAPLQPGDTLSTQTAGLPGMPPATALSGSPRDQYDLAYGFILTGDYALAEQGFRDWLGKFGSDPLAVDAQFWLGESQFNQQHYRDAASTFLAVYTEHGDHAKAPDALLKLGMSLAALGEKNAACATFSEVGRKFPSASPALTSRVGEEAAHAGC